MKFNPTDKSDSIIADIDFRLWGRGDVFNESYPIEDRTRSVNQRLNEVVSIIFRSDSRWKFDDFNHLDMNIYYGSLVGGQQDYEINGADFLTIMEAGVKLKNGEYKMLTPIVREGNTQRLQDMEKATGVPTHYELFGNSILLYPRPSMKELVANKGLMIRAKRLPKYFETTDTDKKPGFNPLYHSYLSIGAALDFAETNEMINKVNILQPKLDRLAEAIEQDYLTRNEGENPTITVKGSREYYDNLHQ